MPLFVLAASAAACGDASNPGDPCSGEMKSCVPMRHLEPLAHWDAPEDPPTDSAAMEVPPPIALGEDHVYFAQFDGALHRVAKAGGAVTVFAEAPQPIGCQVTALSVAHAVVRWATRCSAEAAVWELDESAAGPPRVRVRGSGGDTFDALAPNEDILYVSVRAADSAQLFALGSKRAETLASVQARQSLLPLRIAVSGDRVVWGGRTQLQEKSELFELSKRAVASGEEPAPRRIVETAAAIEDVFFDGEDLVFSASATANGDLSSVFRLGPSLSPTQTRGGGAMASRTIVGAEDAPVRFAVDASGLYGARNHARTVEHVSLDGAARTNIASLDGFSQFGGFVTDATHLYWLATRSNCVEWRTEQEEQEGTKVQSCVRQRRVGTVARMGKP